ncbi:hypothetical protein Poly24_32580 [Rosistilla carotiformis]|uniref:Sulfotransferase domain protein n=1 Tax=Rosistilla carotiformis TaxID=2528017 RepID=A0A518JVG9_9BACT|nr:sulfotransferase [Rosistilla carotiformis]QDV69542.1 hypothetical protein Poly24_32580 [Rosistilla carotiformis]
MNIDTHDRNLKVFGIGMSKTGTSTLHACYRILGLLPSVGYRSDLKQLVRAGRKEKSVNGKFDYDMERPLLSTDATKEILSVARQYVSFQDSPWYLLYRDLDSAFPGSKFILTVRKDAGTQALSDWHHNRKLGSCDGEPDAAFLREQIAFYNDHNRGVQEYFRGREHDLLCVCWENGDGWKELCDFLKLPHPDVAFPHERKGEYTGNECG